MIKKEVLVEKNPYEIDFEEYIRHTDASKKDKTLAWSTAIGLQQVDGLKPSSYLYETAKKNIEENPVYLERFFRNLILGENNELKNRYTHIDYDEYIKKFGDNQKSSEIILELLKENPKLSAKKLSEQIGITSRAVEKQLASLVEKGFIKHEGSPKGGHWEILK